MSQENQQLKRCKYYLFGHCNKKKLCPFSHQMETCQEGRRCKNSVCVKRHPKDCKFYTKCKFSGCNHLHPGKISHKNNTETILFSLDINGEANADRTSINLELERKLDILQSMVKEMEEKAKEQESKLQNKTEEINSLKEKIRYKEDKFKKKDEEVTKLEDKLNSKNERYETAKEFQEKLEIAQNTNLRLEKDIEATREKVKEKEETLQIKKEEVNSLEARVKTDCETWKSNQTRLEEENQKRVDELQNEVKMMHMKFKEVVRELVMVREESKTVHKERTEITKICPKGFVTLIGKHAPHLLTNKKFAKDIELVFCLGKEI